MEELVDVRMLDEWIYAINTALGDLEPERQGVAQLALRRTLDDMGERRAQLRLRRHNELGF